MPQLDILTFLPQIFWLIISFIIFYFTLTYFFLPSFLVILKSRKKFLDLIINLNEQLQQDFLIKDNKFNLKALNTFNLIRSSLFSSLFSSSQFSQNAFLLKRSEKSYKLLVLTLKSLVLYCNIHLLQQIKVKSKLLNKI